MHSHEEVYNKNGQEQESDFQPKNDERQFLWFPFAIAHLIAIHCSLQIWFRICTIYHVLWVIKPFITWPQNTQYKMYGEICYMGLVLAILTHKICHELGFF